MSFFKKRRVDISNMKTVHDYSPTQQLQGMIQTILSMQGTPALVHKDVVSRLLEYLKVSHMFSPWESAPFLGAFGESAVFAIQDDFGNRAILKLCLANFRDSVTFIGNDGKIKERKMSQDDIKTFQTRFLIGIQNQKVMERKISTLRRSFAIPRVFVWCRNPLYMIQEYIDGVTITDYCKDQPLMKKIQVFVSVLDFIDFLNNQGMVHRDLKPENILISTPRGTNQAIPTPYILDWGQSKIAKMRNLTQPVCGFGTSPYAAPETGPLGEYAKANTQSEIYAAGYIFWEIITGLEAVRNIPSKNQGDPEFMFKYHLKMSTALPNELRGVFIKSTEFHPSKRFHTVDEIKAMLKYSYAEILSKETDDISQSQSTIAPCTTFIDTNVSTMEIEPIPSTDDISNIANTLLSVLEKSRRRSK